MGLTPAQAEVLTILLHEVHPLSLIEVGERLVCESGSPSRLVEGMVKAELVERIPSSTDQRKVSLTLTERGEQRCQQVAQIEQFFTHLVNSWGDQVTLDAVTSALWQFVSDKPAGRALARRLKRDVQ